MAFFNFRFCLYQVNVWSPGKFIHIYFQPQTGLAGKKRHKKYSGGPYTQRAA
jgi:hypothetical protein